MAFGLNTFFFNLKNWFSFASGTSKGEVVKTTLVEQRLR